MPRGSMVGKSPPAPLSGVVESPPAFVGGMVESPPAPPGGRNAKPAAEVAPSADPTPLLKSP